MVYGLVSMFTIIVALTFLNFIAWRDMKAEKDRINALETARALEYVGIRSDLAAAKSASDDARKSSEMVKGSHYDTLLKRIDTAEASALGCLRQVETFAEKIASFGGRLSSMAKHAKPKEEEPVPEPILPGPPLQLQQLNGHTQSHFGRKAR